MPLLSLVLNQLLLYIPCNTVHVFILACSCVRLWICSSPKSIRSKDDRDEKQALSCFWRSPAIFHYSLVSCAWYSGQAPQSPSVRKHSSTQRLAGVRMPERVRADGWNDTGHICAISSACSFWSALSQQPIFPAISLKMTCACPCTFIPHYLKTKSYLRWHFKTVFKWRCPWRWESIAFRPSVLTLCHIVVEAGGTVCHCLFQVAESPLSCLHLKVLFEAMLLIQSFSEDKQRHAGAGKPK